MTGLGAAIIHQVDNDEAVTSLQARIEQLQANGCKALVITSLHPVTALINMFDAAKTIDMQAIGFIDCTGEQQQDEPGDSILFVDSPAMVEAVLVRTDRLLKRMGPDTNVIVHTLDAFALYSPPRLVGEFAQCLINNLRSKGVDVEFLTVQSEEGEEVTKHFHALLDEQLAE